MSDVYDEFFWASNSRNSRTTQVSMGDLTPNRPYVIYAVEVTRHPDIGRGVPAYIEHHTKYVFFTGRFRQVTNLHIAAMNNEVTSCKIYFVGEFYLFLIDF